MEESQSDPGVNETNSLVPSLHADGRINLAIITSIREIVGDEGVGQISPATGQYLQGVAEYFAELLSTDNDFSSRPWRDFSRTFNLTAIVIDDWQTERLPPYSGGRPWKEEAYSTIRDNDGNVLATPRLDDLVGVFSSRSWRDLPLRDVQGRAQLKRGYEQEIINFLRQKDVDMILSDIYVSRIESALLRAYPELIVNVHPAITDERNPHRLIGLTPTADAIERVQQRGWNFTGATIHVVDSDWDHGPVIYDVEDVEVFSIDTKPALRFRTYDAQRRVAEQGLVNYVARPDVQQRIQAARERNVIPDVLESS